LNIYKWIAYRLLRTVFVIWGSVTLVFFIFRIVPGDPARIVAGVQSTPQQLAAIRETMGLNKPVYDQYLIYVSQLMHGNLGFSWHTDQPVINDLVSRFPATIELAVTAVLITIAVGIPLGVYSATRKGGVVDQIGRVVSTLGIGMPLFWLGLLLAFVFYFKLHIFPPPLGQLSLSLTPPKTITGLYVVDSLLTGNWPDLISSIRQLILPGLTLSVGSMAILLRMTRASMLEVLQSDYIMTARSKGLPERTVIWKHAFRNALLPITTVVGLLFAYLLGGTVMVETIFSWPGIGKYVVDSVAAVDYAPVEGFVIVAALTFSIINFAVDVFYAFLDPRIKVS
jgi:peptide/nickel transport system permease protein